MTTIVEVIFRKTSEKGKRVLRRLKQFASGDKLVNISITVVQPTQLQKGF
ncbi:MAG TPA: hypothetical protein VIP70_09305 [Nitrososphaeraceae archaeon]